MTRVFVSSIQRGFEDVRVAVKAAIESLDMISIMAESEAASADSPRRALLDRVAQADALVLLLGPRYGELGQSGFSPTEDEYREAERLGKPILVLRQEGDLDPEQEDFLRRTRGGWEAGKFSGSFVGAADVGFAVIKALRGLEQRLAGSPDRAAAAQHQVAEIAAASSRGQGSVSGSRARVITVPLGESRLLDAVALNDGSTADAIANAVRTSGLVTQAMGLDIAVNSDGVHLSARNPRGYGELSYFVGADGTVLAEGPVGGRNQMFAGNRVAADRLAEVVERSLRLAVNVWDVIDNHDDVREAAISIVIPDAQYKVFATEEPGNSMRMPMNQAATIIAPEPAVIVRREDVLDGATVTRLVAEVKRRFADAGAIHPQPA